MSIVPLAPRDLDGWRSQEPWSALLDVSEVEEANAGHIPSSSSIPLRLIPYRLRRILPRTDVPVAVYDQGGDDRRAAAAADLLAEHGFADVLVIDGGMDAWVAAGGVPERGQNVPSKRFGELLTKPDNELHVSASELAGWLADGRDVQIIDVRTHAEHSRECLPGSVHAPGFSVAAAADPTRPIVVHCSGRTRSILGSRTLRLLGFTDVWALENGTMGWVLDGRKVERGTARPALDRGLGGDPAIIARARQLALSVGVELLSPQDAFDRLRASGGRPRQLLDVRELDELGGTSAAGAAQVPNGQIVQRTDEHIVTRGAGVVLLDDGGARALIAGHWLRLLGIEEVVVVDGGVDAWSAAGLPLTPYEPSPDPVGLEDAAGRALIVDAESAEAQVGDGALVVSVDYSDAYARGHLEGAHWVGLSEILARGAQALPGPEGSAVLLTCSDGRASLLAAKACRDDARREVSVLAGGTGAWESSGRRLIADHGNLPEWPTDVHPHPLTVGEHAMLDYLSWEETLDVSADAERVDRLTGR